MQKKLEKNFVAIIFQICHEKSFSKCELLVFPFLESRYSNFLHSVEENLPFSSCMDLAIRNLSVQKTVTASQKKQGKLRKRTSLIRKHFAFCISHKVVDQHCLDLLLSRVGRNKIKALDNQEIRSRFLQLTLKILMTLNESLHQRPLERDMDSVFHKKTEMKIRAGQKFGQHILYCQMTAFSVLIVK